MFAEDDLNEGSKSRAAALIVLARGVGDGWRYWDGTWSFSARQTYWPITRVPLTIQLVM